MSAATTSNSIEHDDLQSLGVANANAPDACAFMDEKRLCAELAISSVTATKWRAKAEGPPFIKVGRLIRYRRTDVEAWLVSRTVGRRPTTKH